MIDASHKQYFDDLSAKDKLYPNWHVTRRAWLAGYAAARDRFEKAVGEEREACAKVVDEYGCPETVADAIRARDPDWRAKNWR